MRKASKRVKKSSQFADDWASRRNTWHNQWSLSLVIWFLWRMGGSVGTDWLQLAPWRIWALTEGRVQDWTYTDALRPGQLNRLGVVADGGHFYFLVNGIVVAELFDDRIPDGAMGSYFNTCDPDGWTIYETDNFELRK